MTTVVGSEYAFQKNIGVSHEVYCAENVQTHTQCSTGFVGAEPVPAGHASAYAVAWSKTDVWARGPSDARPRPPPQRRVLARGGSQRGSARRAPLGHSRAHACAPALPTPLAPGARCIRVHPCSCLRTTTYSSPPPCSPSHYPHLPLLACAPPCTLCLRGWGVRAPGVGRCCARAPVLPCPATPAIARVVRFWFPSPSPRCFSPVAVGRAASSLPPPPVLFAVF